MRAAVLALATLVTGGTMNNAALGQPIIDGKPAKNLCTIHTVTSGPYSFTHAYPTARTWHRDNRRLFVESPGPGPDGQARKNERHLLAIDVETGKTEYLVTVRHSNPDTPPAPFMFDYAPAANLLAYTGPEAKTIHVHNLDTGMTKELYREGDGTLGGPLTLAWDGTRIAWWSMIDSKESRWFDDYLTVIFTQEIDPISNKVEHKDSLAICEAWPRRKLPGWTQRDGPGVHVNHPQINPRDRDHICYAHDLRGAPGTLCTTNARLWEVRADGSGNRCLTLQPATHEVIAPDGKSILFPYMHGLGQVVFATGEARSLYFNPRCCPGHITIHPSGRWVAGDTWNRWTDESGGVWQSIMLLEVETRRCAHLCWFRYSHPHPIFSQDGNRIAFSYLDDDDHQQVAWIDVRDVLAHWETVYQDEGLEQGPAWVVGE